MFGRDALAEEVDLVDLARNGDPRAFSDLYSLHAPVVRRVAAAYVRQPDIVADIVQDTFTRALEKLPTLRENNRFRPWLLSIARHSAIDHGRRASRDAGLESEVAEALPDHDPGPYEALEVSELARQVTSSIAGLSRRDATAIALVTYLGMGPAEVAAALGISPGAAKVTVHRARRRLRTALSLEALRKQPDVACAEMQPILADTAAASRHLERCTECLAAASDEVTAFDFSPAPEATAATGQGLPPERPRR